MSILLEFPLQLYAHSSKSNLNIMMFCIRFIIRRCYNYNLLLHSLLEHNKKSSIILVSCIMSHHGPET